MLRKVIGQAIPRENVAAHATVELQGQGNFGAAFGAHFDGWKMIR